MKNYSAPIILTLLCLGLFFVLHLSFENNKEDTVIYKNHPYDYLLEVNGDSVTTYNLYDEKHNVVKENILASELDSIIIKDNE